MPEVNQQDSNTRQIGGGHYHLAPYQHWDLVADCRLGYFEGQITKYVMRWREKNGLDDLLKAKHFLEKLSSLYGAGRMHRTAPESWEIYNFSNCFKRFLQYNRLSAVEERIFVRLAQYAYPMELDQVHSMLAELIVEARRDKV